MHTDEKIIGSIYAYATPINMQPVYIGQSRDVIRRHKSHLKDTNTTFDRTFISDDTYIQIILEEKEIVTDESNEVEELIGLHEWMNEREIHYITHYDTYDNGLNFTRGGQWGSSRAHIEAADKRRRERFEYVYMPFLRKHHREHGNINHLDQKGPYGWLQNSIRSESMKVPSEFQSELFGDLGFDMRDGKVIQSESFWTKFIDAAEWWMREYHIPMGSVHRDDTLPENDDIPEHIRGYPLGNNLHSFRGKNNHRPIKEDEEKMERLLNIGFTWTTSRNKHNLASRNKHNLASRSKHYINARVRERISVLERLHTERGHINMKQGEANPEWMQGEYRLYYFLNGLKSDRIWNNTLQTKNKAMLTSLGFDRTDNEFQDRKFLEALVYFYENEQTSRPPRKYKMPNNDDGLPKYLHGFQLGVMFCNRTRRNSLREKATQLIAIYNDMAKYPHKYKPPPSIGDKKRIAVEACAVGCNCWVWYKSRSVAADHLGVCNSQVSMCCTGRSYSAKS